MRHIIQSELISKISDELIKEAEEALEELVKKTPKERKKFIRTNTLWTKYRDALCEVSDDKCWYSERKFSRTELEVEHFRPKGEGATVKHPGYWWLAYNWRNFRLSSSLANKRREDLRNRNKQIMGKGTYFPLEDETKRAPDQDPAKLAEEKPLLTDQVDTRRRRGDVRGLTGRIYPEARIGDSFFSPSRIIKELDPVCFNMGVTENLDNLGEDGRLYEYGGDYDDIDELDDMLTEIDPNRNLHKAGAG